MFKKPVASSKLISGQCGKTTHLGKSQRAGNAVSFSAFKTLNLSHSIAKLLTIPKRNTYSQGVNCSCPNVYYDKL